MKASASPCDSQPELVIHAVMERFVEISAPLKHAATKKRGGLTNEAYVAKSLEIPRLRRVWFDDSIGDVDVVSHSINHVNLRTTLEFGYDFRQGAWIVNIIGIQPPNELARRPPQSLINCGCLAVVLLRDPRQLFRVALKHFERHIRAAPVEHNIFERLEPLR